MKYTLRYNVRRIQEDMARRGWMASHLSRECGLSVKTVTNFLGGGCQTPKTAHKIATALDAKVDRYLVTSDKRSAA